MKKNYLFAAMALVAFAGCSDSEFVGEVNTSPDSGIGNDNAIVFSSGANSITRADKTGKDAADELNNRFVVGGFKGATSVATTTVFDNYYVDYTANTANTTESNTKNWEYVGIGINSLSAIYDTDHSLTQTIKYWDYSQAQYDFIAYSLGTGGGTPATVTAITPATAGDDGTNGAYKVTGTTDQLKTVHIADLKTVLKADYNKVVELNFRSLISKIRIALYETVPGYSVKDVRFYTSDDAISGGSTSTTAALYAPSSTALPISGTYTVYFPTINSETPTSDKNRAHVKFTAAATDGTQTSQTFGTLEESGTLNVSQKYEFKENSSYSAETKYLLGRQSNQATYAGVSPYYVDVLPLETGTSLTLKVDYTLVSIDGSKENIKVVGAKAVVPAIYAQWKPGFAYTYIFKISDNSNGWTSGAENTLVQGLHPITFDAVVETAVEDNIQETVTTVATPSITTYQNEPAVNASANNEYKAGTVYAMVMNGGTLITDLNGTTSPEKAAARLYSLSGKDSPSEADVMDALLMQASVSGTTITGRNGLVLTAGTIDNEIADEDIPGPDGNKIEVADGAASKLTVSAGTYAYVYTVRQPTLAGTTDKYEAVPASAIEVGTTDVSSFFIYTVGSGYSQASGNAATGVTYYAKYTVNDGDYAVKVIKVVN